MQRKESRVEPLDLATHEAAARDSASNATNDADATAALTTLSTSEREVVRLKFQHGLKYREIAAVTGLSISNVGYLIHCAIKKMRSTLGGTP